MGLEILTEWSRFDESKACNSDYWRKATRALRRAATRMAVG